MKKAFIFFAVILLTGCATDSYRIDYRNQLLSKHPEWSEKDRQAICKGQIKLGMSKDQVIAAVGYDPDSTTKNVSLLGKMETLTFRSGAGSLVCSFEFDKLVDYSEI